MLRRWPRWVCWVAWAAALLLAPHGPCPAQPPPMPEDVLPKPRVLVDPSPTEPTPPAQPVPMPTATRENPAVGITLVDALRIALLSNLDIAQARAVVRQGQAGLLRAEVIALPNANIGGAFDSHAGRIQKTEGNIETINRQSLLLAMGPSLSLGLSDVVFARGIASQVVAALRAGQLRITNDTLLAVADAYFNVLRARRRVARLDETLEFLTSERTLALRGDSPGLLPLITSYVRQGLAAPSEQARVEVEVLRRQDELSTALQDLRTAMAELSRLLHLDPTVILWPLEDFRVPLPIPGDDWAASDLPTLAQAALNNRPDMAEARALVGAALARVRAAQWRPLLPNLAVTYNWGGFGGGPEIIATKPTVIFGHSGSINDFGVRDDLNISVFWRLQNMGLGNKAEVREQKALHDQAVLHQLQAADRVVAQVVQAQEQVRRGRERLAITRYSLFDASGAPTGPVYRSLRLNFLRIKRGEGRPLEVLDAVRSLSDLLDAYATDMTDYERARFRLLNALGMPPQALIDPNLMPPAPAAPCPPTPAEQPPPGPGH
jgi:outer membrane protein TolC